MKKLGESPINLPGYRKEMTLTWGRKKGLPESHGFREKLSDWMVLVSRELNHKISSRCKGFLLTINPFPNMLILKIAY